MSFTKKLLIAEQLVPGKLVGMTGFEPATSRSRTERSTKLSHIPTRTYDFSTPAEGLPTRKEATGLWMANASA